MSTASEQWNRGPGLGVEESIISVDLECSNGFKIDHSECLNNILFHIKNIPENHREQAFKCKKKQS